MFYFILGSLVLLVMSYNCDFPVSGPLHNLYNKSKVCAICSDSCRHLVKEEQILLDVNEESIDETGGKSDDTCFFKRLIIFGICQRVTL